MASSSSGKKGADIKAAHLLVGIALIVGGGFYVLAITSTYTLVQLVASGFDPMEMVAIGLVAGIGELIIGYWSMILFGGKLSLGVAEFFTKVTRSKQVIEIRKDEGSRLKGAFLRETYIGYTSFIVFVITIAIAFDFYNAGTIRSGFAKPYLDTLNIFSRAISVNSILYSVQVTPVILFFSFLAGIIPSVSLPYFRKFKVTGVNSGRFHTSLLIYVVSAVAGIGVIFTLFGLFYETLYLGRTPLYYHFIMADAIGLSIYYGIGSYLGLQRAEEMLRNRLLSRRGANVITGSITLNPEA